MINKIIDYYNKNKFTNWTFENKRLLAIMTTTWLGLSIFITPTAIILFRKTPFPMVIFSFGLSSFIMGAVMLLTAKTNNLKLDNETNNKIKQIEKQIDNW